MVDASNVARVNAVSRPFDYVVNIWMENKSCPGSLGSIGGSSTPYELSLATTYAYDNCHYSALVNPSLPNYMGFWAGQYPSCATGDSDPSGCSGGSATNIVDRLEAAGLTWKAFAENYPVSQGCGGSYQSSGGGYYARHFPPVYYTDITSNPARCANLLNAGSGDANFLGVMNQASGWPNFIWLSPNGCDDTHDCSAATGDSWLATLVPKILSSTLFATQNAAVVITWDEGYPVMPGPIFAGPAVKRAYVGGTNSYNHYNWLSTILANYGLSCIANDCGKTQMTEFFGQSTPPPPPVLTTSFTSTPTTISIGTLVTFTGTATGGTSPYSFSWSFGDGSAATGSPATHSYAANGTYSVTLTVTDSASPASTATSKNQVTVGTPPPGASSWSMVDFDPEFNTAASEGGSNNAYSYWHPNTHGASTNDAYVSSGEFHSRQNDTASTGWGSFDNAVAHEAIFPWQTDCGHVSGQPPNWACGRNTYGLATSAHSGFPVNVSASLNYLAFKCGSSCEYDTFIGVYWYFVNGPVTGNGCTQYWMEQQIRLTSYHAGRFDAVGVTETWCTFDFGYTTVLTQLQPGQSYALDNYDLGALYQTGLSKWGLPSTTKAILIGVEIGSEGYGAAISTDWNYVRIQAYEQDAVRADVNYDWLVNSSDLSLVQTLPGPCPANYGTYQWRANANASNACINSDDTAYVSRYIGSIISPPNQVRDFSVAANPTSLSSNSGSTTTSTITIAPVNGFTGTVALTSSVSPSTGQTCTLSPTSIVLGSSQTSTLSCSGTAGTYTVTVSGTSGETTHTATVAITTHDFQISATPSSVSLMTGSSATSNITVSGISAFTGTVSLTSTVSQAGVTCTLNPTSVTFGTSPQTSTLSCTGSAGTYTVNVTGTNGGQSRTTTVTVTMTDFTLAANRTSINVVAGASGSTSTITVAPINGLTGIVALTATGPPSGCTATLNPTSVTLGVSQTSTLTVSCTSVPSPKAFTITVTGSNNGQARTVSVSVTVTAAPSHSTTTSVVCSPTPVVVGASSSCTATVTDTNSSPTTPTGIVSWSLSGVTGSFSPTTCTLSGTGASSSCSVSFTATTTGIAAVTGSYGGDTTPSPGHTASSGNATIAVPNFTLLASPTSMAIVAGNAATSTITVTGVNGFAGTVALTSTVSPAGLTCGVSLTSVTLPPTPQTSTLSCTGSMFGTFTVTITGTNSGQSRAATVTVTVVDFAVTTNPPTTISVVAGSAGSTSTITVAPVNGFTGTVALTATGAPSGCAATLNPSSVTLGASQTTPLTVICTVVPTPNPFIVTVTGTNSGQSRTTTISVTVTVATPHTTTTSVACSPTIVVVGASTLCTATVTDTGASPTTPTGTVSWSVAGVGGNFSPATCTLSGSGGSASCSVSFAANTTGSATITSSYGGDSTSSPGHTASSGSAAVTVTDFTISASPSSVTVVQGNTATSTVTIAGVNGFIGIVYLALDASPSGLSCALSSTSVIGPGTSDLNCQGSATGRFTVTVTGTSGSLLHSTTVSVNVGNLPDFSMTANPSSLSVLAGETASFSITINSLNGFTGGVTLASSVSPSGTTCTLNPPSVVLGTSQASTLSCTGSAGTSTVTVAGTGSGITHTATVTVTVQDFTISASPGSISLAQGGSVSSTVTVTAASGFSGVVSLTSSISPGSGLTCTLTPTSVTRSGTSTLSCSSSTLNTYTVTVTGTSGSLSHTTTVTVTVTAPTDFSATASPTSVTVLAGATATSTINVAPVNGFTGTVALTSTVSPAGLSCTLSPTSIVLGASQTSTLACSGPGGTYTVTITGTSNSITHVATVTVTVTDYTVTASPTSVIVLAGATGTSTITVSPVNGFRGTVALTLTVSPAGLTCTLTQTSVVLRAAQTSTLSCTGATATTFTVIITSTSGPLSHSATATFTVQDFTISASPTSVSINVGGTGTSMITIAPVNGFTRTVSLASTVSSTSGLTCTLSPTSVTGGNGTSTLSCSSSTSGSFIATVTGTSGSLSHSTPVSHSVAVADFSVSASPTSVTVLADATGSSTITIAPINGFTGAVALTSSVSPADLACSLSPSSIVLGEPQTSTLSCSGPAGVYSISVTGTSGSLSHTAIVSITGQDFTISPSPTSIAYTTGGSATSTVTVSSLNGFAGVVNLTTTSSTEGTTCNLSPTRVTGSGGSTLLCSGSTVGSYTVTITGTSAFLLHSATVRVDVGNAPDYSIATAPTGVSVLAGGRASSTVTVAPLGGFTGTVNLAISVSPSPSSLTCNLNPQSIILGASQISTLSCSGPSGTYMVTVTGTSVQLSHSGTITFTVQDFDIKASPTDVSAYPGDVGTSAIAVSSINGFTGTVGLASTVSAAGLTCSLSPTSVILGTFQSSTLSCSGSKGTYTVTVTGATGALSHSIVVSFIVNGSVVGPIVNVAGPQTVTAGNTISFNATFTVSDPTISRKLISLSASGLPHGASFDSSSGIFSWTPASNVTGDFTVAFTAMQASSPPLSDTKTVKITVLAGGASCLSCWIGYLSRWADNSMSTMLLFVLGGTIGLSAALTVQTLRVKRKYSRVLRQSGRISPDHGND